MAVVQASFSVAMMVQQRLLESPVNQESKLIGENHFTLSIFPVRLNVADMLKSSLQKQLTLAKF